MLKQSGRTEEVLPAPHAQHRLFLFLLLLLLFCFFFWRMDGSVTSHGNSTSRLEAEFYIRSVVSLKPYAWPRLFSLPSSRTAWSTGRRRRRRRRRRRHRFDLRGEIAPNAPTLAQLGLPSFRPLLRNGNLPTIDGRNRGRPLRGHTTQTNKPTKKKDSRAPARPRWGAGREDVRWLTTKKKSFSTWEMLCHDAGHEKRSSWRTSTRSVARVAAAPRAAVGRLH